MGSFPRQAKRKHWVNETLTQTEKIKCMRSTLLSGFSPTNVTLSKPGTGSTPDASCTRKECVAWTDHVRTVLTDGLGMRREDYGKLVWDCPGPKSLRHRPWWPRGALVDHGRRRQERPPAAAGCCESVRRRRRLMEAAVDGGGSSDR